MAPPVTPNTNLGVEMRGWRVTRVVRAGRSILPWLRRLPRELDHLPRPQDRGLERLTRRHRADLLADLRHVRLARDPDAGYRQDDVAANHELLSADGCGPVTTGKPHVPGRRPFRDHAQEQAATPGNVEDLGQLARHDSAFEPDPRPLAFHQEVARTLHRHDEAEPLAAPALGDVVAHDPDDLTGRVEHGATRVPRVDRGRRLEELGERHRAVGRVGQPLGADPARAERVRETVGGADDQHLLPDVNLVGIAESSGLRVLRDAGELDQAQVGRGFRGNHPCWDCFATEHLDDDLVHRMDDVRGGHDLAVRGNHDAGTDLREGDEALRADHQPDLGPDTG